MGVPPPPWRFRRPEDLLSEARAKARAPVQGPQRWFWGSPTALPSTPPWRFRRPEELLSEARARARAPVQGPQRWFWGSPTAPPPPPPGDKGGGGSTRREPRASTHSGGSSSTRGVGPRASTHRGSGRGSEDQGGVGAGAQGRREDPIEVAGAPPCLARTRGRRALVCPRNSPAAPEWGGSQSKRLKGVPPPPAARAARSLASTLATMPSGHGRSSTSST